MSEDDVQKEKRSLRENRALIKQLSEMILPKDVRKQIAKDIERGQEEIWSVE